MSAETDALSAAGIPFRGDLNINGELHRYKTEGDSEANCWYVFREAKGIVSGGFGCWKRQISQRYCSVDFKSLTTEQRHEQQEAWAASQNKAREETLRLHGIAATEARRIVDKCEAPDSHPYTTAKGVKVFGCARLSDQTVTEGWLALPLEDERGVIHTCQFVADDGTKRFQYGGRVQGCFFKILGPKSGPLLICEGYATGASLHEATGWTVLCAMFCGNLMAVATAARKLHPARTILICADNDQFTDGNPGITKAEKAAHSAKALTVFPEFGDESLTSKPTDFNDLHAIEGLPEVRIQVMRSFPVCAKPIGDAVRPPLDDPTELLRHRYLCERASLLICGPSGMGKSSFLMQCLACWSNGLPCVGIMPKKPLRAVLVQAENDDGDLAEMRDGVAAGLKFNADQRHAFFNGVLFLTSTGLTGKQFCDENLRPLLDLHNPNIIAIDPALSFLGGDVKEQKVVGEFLRAMLNPILFSHNCSSVVMHHTNKPIQGKEKAEWRNGELAYLGSGSAEWTNWARAILTMQSTGEHGLYKLNASKRGSRIGWKDDADEMVFQKHIAHSREAGVMCWHETEAPEGESSNNGGSTPKENTGGRHSMVDEIAFSNLFEFCSQCVPEGEGKNQIAARLEFWLANTEPKRGVSTSTCKRIVERLIDNGKLTKGAKGEFLKGKSA